MNGYAIVHLLPNAYRCQWFVARSDGVVLHSQESRMRHMMGRYIDMEDLTVGKPLLMWSTSNRKGFGPKHYWILLNALIPQHIEYHEKLPEEYR